MIKKERYTDVANKHTKDAYGRDGDISKNNGNKFISGTLEIERLQYPDGTIQESAGQSSLGDTSLNTESNSVETNEHWDFKNGVTTNDITSEEIVVTDKITFNDGSTLNSGLVSAKMYLHKIRFGPNTVENNFRLYITTSTNTPFTIATLGQWFSTIGLTSISTSRFDHLQASYVATNCKGVYYNTSTSKFFAIKYDDTEVEFTSLFWNDYVYEV